MWNRYIFVKITVPADILRLGICLASPRSTPSVYKYTLEIRPGCWPPSYWILNTGKIGLKDIRIRQNCGYRYLTAQI